MKPKNFKLSPEQMQDLVPGLGACYATDHITVDGMLVGYMYRDEPDNEHDSGWRFFSGHESQEYVDNAKNLEIYDVNTISNYDKAIIPYLGAPVGIELQREQDSESFSEVGA